MNSKKLIYTGLTTISVILVFVMFTAVASAAPPEITSFAPPSPVYDDTCALSTFNVTLDQTVNVNWYLDNSLLFTDVSVTEAKCSLKTDVTGEHNVSAIATNQNGTDMQTWIWNVAGCGGSTTYIHRYLYRDEEVYIDEIHRTVAGYAHYDLGPSFYSNDWDIWHVGSWSDLTADEIAYLDTVTGLSAGIWYYIDLLNQTVATTPFENYSEEIGREVTEEIFYEEIDSYTTLITHIITTTVTYKDHCYQLIVKVEDVTTAVDDPDLVITGKWLCWPDNCTICYNVTNIGDGTAPAGHNTTLHVDGVAVAHDHVLVDLAPGESYTGCFNGYVWTYTPPSDNITVCADNNEALVELDEDNNCLANIWMCGDVNGDRAVNVIDVVLIYKRALDPGYPLDLPWAGDVNCDCNINVIDVVMVYKRALDPGYDLDCCCEVV